MDAESLQPSGFLKLLEELVSAQPGIKEFDLVMQLKRRGTPFFAEVDLWDSLQLYRAHFLLFHHLYQLRDILLAEGRGILEIHCLEIRILPYLAEVHQALALEDGLRDYYLDLGSALQVTQEQVEGMIRDFWKDYERFHHRGEAYATLGLEPGASKEAVQARFRELAKLHHPDQGGEAEAFMRIEQAKKDLLG